MFTIGYLSFDFVMTFLFNHENNSLTYQTYFHHIAAILSFYCALVLKPNTSPLIICAITAQLTEVSTPFMNLRQLLYIHKLGDSVLALINGLLFALTFIFGRMAVQASFIWVVASWVQNEWRTRVHVDYSIFEQVGFYFCCSTQILMLMLNSYWMMLILKGLLKLGRKGKPHHTKKEASKKDN